MTVHPNWPADAAGKAANAKPASTATAIAAAILSFLLNTVAYLLPPSCMRIAHTAATTCRRVVHGTGWHRALQPGRGERAGDFMVPAALPPTMSLDSSLRFRVRLAPARVAGASNPSPARWEGDLWRLGRHEALALESAAH